MVDEPLRQKLIDEAFQAREQAYAPYSRFRVGAAVLASDGETFAGGNMENASFGATLCAERVALAKAVSAGKRRFTAIAVVADTPEPVPPCGLCLQVIAEFSRDTLVIMATLAGKWRMTDLKTLLPCAFRWSPAASAERP